MSKKLIRVMDTSFRDGFQSCIGARVLTEDYLPAIQAAKEAGINHFETGGGALFQSMVFYANENPFENMDKVRQAVGNDVKLQTLARGVNVVGLESQSSDIIDLHARMFKKHGVTTIRNFDALNDVNNLIYSAQCIKNAGLNHEVTVTMMELPPGCSGAHTPEFYTQKLRSILDSSLPFDSVAFKDASGTSSPQKVYETIKAARELLGSEIEIRFHSHETAGCSIATYRAALDGGANGLDLAMSPMSGGTCQPDHITMWHALKDTEYDLGYDINKIVQAEEVFKESMKQYFMPPEATKVDPIIVFSPMPGGALTANTQMMRDNGTLDKFPLVIKAMQEVVEKGGFGTSVTPVSQFYFQQAYNNVMFGPWEKIADGYGKMVLGYFGKTPCTPDAEIMKIAQEQLELEPTTKNPREINDENPLRGIEPAKAKLEEAKLPVTEENLFITAACGDKGIQFLLGNGKVNVRKIDPNAQSSYSDAPCDKRTDGYTVSVNGKKYAVAIEADKAVVNGKVFDVKISKGIDAQTAQDTTEATPIKAALPGSVLKINVSPGDKIDEGDLILVLEAMKMETEVKSPISGTVKSVEVEVGGQVQSGQVLVMVGK